MKQLTILLPSLDLCAVGVSWGTLLGDGCHIHARQLLEAGWTIYADFNRYRGEYDIKVVHHPSGYVAKGYMTTGCWDRRIHLKTPYIPAEELKARRFAEHESAKTEVIKYVPVPVTQEFELDSYSNEQLLEIVAKRLQAEVPKKPKKLNQAEILDFVKKVKQA